MVPKNAAGAVRLFRKTKAIAGRVIRRKSVKSSRKRIVQEQRSIQLFDSILPYTLRHNPRAKHVRLAVHHDSTLHVTTPPKVSIQRTENYLRLKEPWIREALARVSLNPRNIPPATQEDYLRHKSAALALVKRKVTQFNQLYQLQFQSITIRNQKTRWGSCSKTGNLNFSYRIALLPEEQADYIIVHELCHLREFNHSPQFWQMVAQTIPSYRERRKELRV